MSFDPSSGTTAFFQELCETGVRQSAERVWSACEILIESAGDGRLVNVASVGRLCTKLYGGPKAQSIRNQTKTLKTLVLKIHSDHGPTDLKTTAKTSPASVEHHLLLEQISHLRASNSRLHKLIKSLGPFDVNLGEDGLPTLTTPNLIPNANHPTTRELDALSRFLSPSFQGQSGLHVDKAGNLRFGKRVLMESHAMQFLKRTLNAASEITAVADFQAVAGPAETGSEENI